MTIKEDGTTVYDFQPVIRHDGKFGFYDRKTATFVQPARGSYDGYSFAKLEDQAYMTYAADTRIVIVGSTAQFLPDVQNLDEATFTWTSADESIATVAADGTVTGKAAGKVMITVATDADQGWTASYELTVSEPNYVRRDANGVGYAIITGGNGWGDSPLSALLDNDATTKFGTSNVGEAWAIMIASEPVAVQQYSIVTGADTYNYPSRNPVSWKLEGSNDNQTWTLIDEKVQTYQLQAKNKEEFEFPVNGTETYKFFKFSATQLLRWLLTHTKTVSAQFALLRLLRLSSCQHVETTTHLTMLSSATRMKSLMKNMLTSKKVGQMQTSTTLHGTS